MTARHVPRHEGQKRHWTVEEEEDEGDDIQLSPSIGESGGKLL